MAYKISWTDNALEDYQKIIEYLLAKWSLSVAIDFESKVNKKLSILSKMPSIGISSLKSREIKSILLTKHNRLFYRIKGGTIELLNIFDTRQHPDKKPF